MRKSGLPTKTEIRKDIDVILWSLRLHSLRRYTGNRFWAKEAQDALYADKLETRPKLESVSEHSWHVADIVLLLAPYNSNLDLERCLKLSILHDKMEIIIGDINPLGRDGTGQQTHAFNAVRRERKDQREIVAIERYTEMLRPHIRSDQADILQEMILGATQEAQFVKAVDKLQALSFILLKKRGEIEDQHIRFLVRFTNYHTSKVPLLQGHKQELFKRLFRQVARRRGITVQQLMTNLYAGQAQLPLFDSELVDMVD